MIEWLGFPLLLVAAAAMPKKVNDRKKIETIFKNVRYGVPGKEGKIQTPKYRKKSPILDGEKEIGTAYHFSIPLGLPATKMAKLEKEIRVFTDGLNKPVELEYKKTLNVKVYNEELPELFPYKELPKRLDQWAVPIGKAVNGIVWHNFDHTPHMTIAGTTRFGKTVCLRVVTSYLVECHPDDVEFYIIDLKGGLEFGRYEHLRQVKGVAANAEEAALMLEKLHEDYQKLYVEFRKKNISNVVDTDIKMRRFIIVDEAAQLAPEKWMSKEQKSLLGMCQYYLGEIARVTGALSYRLIFATQYPTSDTLPRSIKQNADAKISFRLPSGYASAVAIDDYGAEELPSDIKGRALFKTHELKEMQVPFISHEEMWARLEKYQEPSILEGDPENVIEYREKEESPGENLVKFGEDEVRD